MRRPRQRATPESIRKAMRIGAVLVSRGYCTVGEIGEALELVRRGRFGAAEERELSSRAFYDDSGFECWQAHLLPTPLETLAGERQWCGGLVVHIDDIADLFDQRPEIKFSVDHDEIFFSGNFQEQGVVVIVYTAPPEDEPTQGIVLENGSVRWLGDRSEQEKN